MAHYPQGILGLSYISYPVGPVVNTTITPDPGTTINTKGAYVQIVASTPFTTNRIKIGLAGTTNTTQTWLCDIAIGAPGSEVVVLPDLMSDMSNTGSSIGNAGWHEFPLTIPAGTRLSVRCQCNASSRLLGVYVTLIIAGDTPGIPTFITYGASIAGSRGTNIDPGATVNVKGSYTQITPSTTGIIQWLMIQTSHFGANDPIGSGWALDLATGAAGSEIVLIPDIRVQMPASATGTVIPRSHAFLTYIPAGTRIAVRASCTVNTVTSRTIDVTLITAPAPSESSSGGGGGEVSIVSIG